MKFNIKIENFEGPLEVLLHLVELKKMPVHSIQISQIIDDYLELILELKDQDIHIKVDFLVMATELLQIKALNVLKYKEREEKERALEKKIIEYKTIKDLSLHIQNLENEFNISYQREGRNIALSDFREIDLSSLSKDVIFETYYDILERNTLEEELKINIEESYSLDDEMQLIKNRLSLVKKESYIDFFNGAKSRLHIVYIFLAILELYRDKKVDFINDQIILEGSL
jgi:segregation and condensation protein A